MELSSEIDVLWPFCVGFQRFDCESNLRQFNSARPSLSSLELIYF